MDKKTFETYSLLLIPAGLLINIVGAKLALFFGWPLFLDSIGTILSAVLGGYLPGIVVGFFSNIINGIFDPITLYYGIVSIVIAICATFLSRRFVFTNPFKSFGGAMLFALIGGGLGSVLTWMLYGFSFGEGISAPFAIALNNMGLPQFWAQFSADMGIDIVDKILTVAIVFFTLRLLPKKFLSKTNLGYIYYKENKRADRKTRRELVKSDYRLRSLKSKVTFIIILTSIIFGSISTTISYVVYKNTMTEKYIGTADGVVRLMRKTVNAETVDRYLTSKVEDGTYKTTESKLKRIKTAFPDILYMYVYKIDEDGCHVVYDIDTAELPGEKLGAVVPSEEGFEPYLDDLLAGKEIEPIITNGSYGWLLTVYQPIHNRNGRCVAYAGADVSMQDVITDRYVFIIKMISVLFGAAIIIVAITVWFSEEKLVRPINAITRVATDFAYDMPEDRKRAVSKINRLKIKTGDEVENLYNALVKTTEDVMQYVTDIDEKSRIISNMQHGLIISFADMVESRDENTGEHIKHTAGYVKLIAEELMRRGDFPDIINNEYIQNIVSYAPLHDIGKIKIPDAVLNKPGRLTAEEFELMKTHTTAGRDILIGAMKTMDTGTNYLSEAVNMAEYHHERFDGSGYPCGLSGDDIPLSARIMALADVFDALISKRAYKPAMPFDESIEIIKSECGTHFDARIVDAFLAVKDSVKKLSQQ